MTNQANNSLDNKISNNTIINHLFSSQVKDLKNELMIWKN